MPSDLQNQFLLDGASKLGSSYYADKQNGGQGYDWDEKLVNDLSNKPNDCGGYGPTVCAESIEKYAKEFIVGKSGGVFGSVTPWAESFLIKAGAAHITTIEYMAIKSTHPKLSALHPAEIARNYLDHPDSFELLDFAWSYSSFEHDGLGRYGDPINPFADLESVARVHCLLKDGGILFLGFPVGKDVVEWNSHRIYGPVRLHLVLSNWELIDTIGIEKEKLLQEDWRHQPMLVLKKVPNSHSSHSNHLLHLRGNTHPNHPKTD